MVHAFESRGTHPLLQEPIVGEALHAVAQGIGISDRDDKAFGAVREEIFRAGVGGGDDRATAGESLSLHQRQAFLDAGKHKDVASIHEVDEAWLCDGTEVLHVLLRQLREEVAHLALDGAGDAEALVRVPQGGEGLEEVGEAFAQTDGAGEEDFKAIRRRRL